MWTFLTLSLSVDQCLVWSECRVSLGKETIVYTQYLAFVPTCAGIYDRGSFLSMWNKILENCEGLCMGLCWHLVCTNINMLGK